MENEIMKATERAMKKKIKFTSVKQIIRTRE